MKIVIGLGNPGKKYSKTRHNIGFAVLDSFADDKSLKWKEKENAFVSLKDGFILLKPVLFMNQSGPAIMPLMEKYRPDSEDILVIHDDMDIDFGRLHIKKGGASAGHNGVRSIIDTLGTNEFCRMRIGIGRPPENTEPVDFVLSNFTKDESEKMKPIILRAADAVSVFVEDGLRKAMNLFNKRGPDAENSAYLRSRQ